MRIRNSFTALSCLALVGVAGCADPPNLYGDSRVVTTSPGNTTEAPKPDLAMDTYPEGPYGNQTGDTFFDLDNPGYRLTPEHTDTTSVTWEDSITLSSLRSAHPTAKCILISLGASWCGACRQEQSSLPDAIAAQDPASEKIAVYHILMEGMQNGSNKVTKDDVDAWISDFHQTFPTVMSKNNIHQKIWQGWDTNGTIGLPFNLLVDRKTMAVKGHLADATFDGAVKMCEAP